jgi:hypothetical protein
MHPIITTSISYILTLHLTFILAQHYFYFTFSTLSISWIMSNVIDLMSPELVTCGNNFIRFMNAAVALIRQKDITTCL